MTLRLSGHKGYVVAAGQGGRAPDTPAAQGRALHTRPCSRTVAMATTPPTHTLPPPAPPWRRIPANRACAAPLLTSPHSPEGGGGRAAHARQAGGGGGQFNRKHPADLNGRFGRQEGPRPPSWSAEGAPRGGRDERKRRRRRERSGFAARPSPACPRPG